MERGKFQSFAHWVWHALIGRFDNISNLSLDLDKILAHAEVRETHFPEPASQMPKRGVYLYKGNNPPILFGRGNINVMLPNFHYIELGMKPTIHPTRLRRYGGSLFFFFWLLAFFAENSRPDSTSFDIVWIVITGTLLFYMLCFRKLESWFVEQTFYIP